MLISVVIPTYNEEKYIGRCLASLEKQTLDYGDALEIIVIDDGSTDETIHKIQRFPRVKLIHQEHLGAAVARNQGARLARGKILMFMDADMEFDESFAKELCAPIKQGTLQGTFSRSEYVANWENRIARCWNWDRNLPPERRLPLDSPEIGTDFRALLKDEFLRIQGFENTGYTDTWSLKDKLGYAPRAIDSAIFYHHNPSTLSEAFGHARWVGRRNYKFGILGTFFALMRVSLPVSFFLGIYKSAKYIEPMFLIYKIVVDFGIMIGILTYSVFGKVSA